MTKFRLDYLSGMLDSIETSMSNELFPQAHSALKQLIEDLDRFRSMRQRRIHKRNVRSLDKAFRKTSRPLPPSRAGLAEKINSCGHRIDNLGATVAEHYEYTNRRYDLLWDAICKINERLIKEGK